MDELLVNLREVIEGCLPVEIAPAQSDAKQRVLEIAV